MKKKIFIISVVLVGFIVAVAGNSWAQREKGGDRRINRGDQVQKWNGSKDRDVDRSRIHNRAPRLKSKFHVLYLQCTY